MLDPISLVGSSTCEKCISKVLYRDDSLQTNQAILPDKLHQKSLFLSSSFLLPLSTRTMSGNNLTSNRERRLRVVMYSTTQIEIESFKAEMEDRREANVLDIEYVAVRLDSSTAALASGALVVCLFAKDKVDKGILSQLSANGVKLIALRYASVSSFDIKTATELGMQVTCAPKHSPISVAEYAVSLMLSLNRKIHIADKHVRAGNMNLDGLVGFNMASKTVGIIGMGKVGCQVARILEGFGSRVLAYDVMEEKEMLELRVEYVSMTKLFQNSDIISLHCPLVPSTHHIIGNDTLTFCKSGVLIINTAHGSLVDMASILEALRSKLVAGFAMDVYEEESSLFLPNENGGTVNWDIQLLKSLPNVVITWRQSVSTTNALARVAKSTVYTLMQYHNGEELDYRMHQITD